MKIYTVSLFLFLISLLTGCWSTSHDHDPKPEPKPLKVQVVYKDGYNGDIPGTTVSEQEGLNIMNGGSYEKFYHNRYISTDNVMMSSGTSYRIVQSPYWNTRPNPEISPLEMNEAYKYIHNLANATPLHAELELNVSQSAELNKELIVQISIMKQIINNLNNKKTSSHKISNNRLTRQSKTLSNIKEIEKNNPKTNIKDKKFFEQMENKSNAEEKATGLDSLNRLYK